MTLGEIIKNYRINQRLSQRQFATACQLSNGYISMIEEGLNPKTAEPILPSIATLKKIADGMGMPLNELLTTADDMPVIIEEDQKTPVSHEDNERSKEFISLYTQLTPDQQAMLISQIKGLLANQ